MSLAQKLDGEAAVKPEDGPPPAPPPGGAKAGTPIDFRHLMRRAPPTPQLVSVGGEPPAQAAREAAPKPSGPANVALELVNEVATALPTLMRRCQSLEKALSTTKEQARRDVETASAKAAEWQQKVGTLRTRVEQLESELAVLRQRAEAAEREVASIRATAEKSQRAAAEAECLASLFQEKVLTAFGVGTAGHSILEGVRSRTQQMLTA